MSSCIPPWYALHRTGTSVGYDRTMVRRRVKSGVLTALLLLSTVAGAGVFVASAAQNPDDNDMSQATPIEVGAATNGTIESTTDADWYKINVPDDKTLFATIAARDIGGNGTTEMERDVKVTLYGPQGKHIASRSTNLIRSGYGVEYSTAEQVDGGTYFLKVNGTYSEENDGKQGYTLSTSTIEQDPYEPNDQVETATQLDGDADISAHTLGLEEDLYTIDVDAGETVTVDYTETNDPGVDTGHEAFIRAPNGSQVTSSDDGGDTTLTFTASEDGTYVISIWSGQDYYVVEPTDVNRYDLTVDVTDSSENGDESDNDESDGDAGDGDSSIAFDEQESNGERVVVQSLQTQHDGFVVITNEEGDIVGTTSVDAGTHDDLTVNLTETLGENQKLTATVYEDVDEDGEYDENDHSVTVDGDVVSDVGCIDIK